MYQAIATEKVGVPIKGRASSSRVLHGAKQPKGWRVRSVAFGLPGMLPVTLRPRSRGDSLAHLWNRMTNIAVGTARKPHPISPDSPPATDGVIEMTLNKVFSAGHNSIGFILEIFDEEGIPGARKIVRNADDPAFHDVISQTVTYGHGCILVVSTPKGEALFGAIIIGHKFLVISCDDLNAFIAETDPHAVAKLTKSQFRRVLIGAVRICDMVSEVTA